MTYPFYLRILLTKTFRLLKASMFAFINISEYRYRVLIIPHKVQRGRKELRLFGLWSKVNVKNKRDWMEKRRYPVLKHDNLARRSSIPSRVWSLERIEFQSMWSVKLTYTFWTTFMGTSLKWVEYSCGALKELEIESIRWVGAVQNERGWFWSWG